MLQKGYTPTLSMRCGPHDSKSSVSIHRQPSTPVFTLRERNQKFLNARGYNSAWASPTCPCGAHCFLRAAGAIDRVRCKFTTTT